MRKIWTPKIFLPQILLEEEQLNAARLALEPELAKLSRAALECLFMPRLDLLPEHIVDILANQFHVDFYEPHLSLDEKRELVRDAIRFHRIKGTPAAIEEITRKIFADAHIEEWFQFDGEPYHFRLLMDITDDSEDADRFTLDRLRAAVVESKNTRSWIDFYGFILNPEESINATETHLLNPKMLYNDFYDYRRTIRRHDGTLKLGNYYHYDGVFRMNGALNYRGFDTEGNYGQRQASDFEVISFVNRIDTFEPVDVVAQNVFVASLSSRTDSIGAFDDPIAFMPIMQHIDFVRPVEQEHYISITVGGFDDTFDHADERALLTDVTLQVDSVEPSEDHIDPFLNIIRADQINISQTQSFEATLDISEPVDADDQVLITCNKDFDDSVSLGIEHIFPHPVLYTEEDIPILEHNPMSVTLGTFNDFFSNAETAVATCRQHISYSGKDRYNGQILYNGALILAFDIDDLEMNEKWQALKSKYQNSFDEPCQECGSKSYQFLKGSVRLGSERFLISDPQILTLRIACADCGNIIAEYLTKENFWEALTS